MAPARQLLALSALAIQWSRATAEGPHHHHHHTASGSDDDLSNIALMRRESEEASLAAVAGKRKGRGPAGALAPDAPSSGSLLQTSSGSSNSTNTSGTEQYGAVRATKGTWLYPETVKILAGEATLACLNELPVATCMDRYGSFGFRRLYTETYDYIIKYGWDRPDWMSMPAVQRSRIMELIMPMTHGSASAEIQGSTDGVGVGKLAIATTQTLNIYQQLRLGVRALDFGIAEESSDNSTLWVARGTLNVDLRTALLQIKRFLGTYKKEVVYIFAGKADLWGTDGSLAGLKAEEEDTSKIPGQTVHEAVRSVLGDYLATHAKLDQHLPESEHSLENPRVHHLVSAGARVMYFWEGQQVLCLTLAECKATPGWQRHVSGEAPLPFGAPMAPGERAKKIKSTTGRVMEPLCVAPSGVSTVDEDPLKTIESFKNFEHDPVTAFSKSRPSCYPSDAVAPPLRAPTVLHEGDAYLRATLAREENLDNILGSSSTKYTAGEAVTAKSASERLNFMLLSIVMKRREEESQFFLNTQFLALDFIHPIFVHRLVEYNQAMPECGFDIHCLETGSCFAASKLMYTIDYLGGYCIPEVVNAWWVQERSEEGDWKSWQYAIMGVIFLLFVKLSVVVCIGSCSDYKAFPTWVRNDDFRGCICLRKSATAGKGLETAPDQMETLDAPPPTLGAPAPAASASTPTPAPTTAPAPATARPPPTAAAATATAAPARAEDEEF
mmetsp:Transcript_35188/g.74895  ORF Transcript_35188/g.74895 Transcript_35188/m.74895 type:complete len:725 (+) Transcript_35188:217-2391(+)